MLNVETAASWTLLAGFPLMLAATVAMGASGLGGKLYFGRDAGIAEIDLLSGAQQDFRFDLLLFNPTHVSKDTFLAELYPGRIVRANLQDKTTQELRSGRQPVYVPGARKVVFIDRGEDGVERLFAVDIDRIQEPAKELSAGPYEGLVPIVPVDATAVAFVSSLGSKDRTVGSLVIHDFRDGISRPIPAAEECLPLGWRKRTREMLCNRRVVSKWGLAWVQIDSGDSTPVPAIAPRFTPVVYLASYDVLLHLVPRFKLAAPENKELRAYRFSDQTSWTILESAPGWVGSMTWVPSN